MIRLKGLTAGLISSEVKPWLLRFELIETSSNKAVMKIPLPFQPDTPLCECCRKAYRFSVILCPRFHFEALILYLHVVHRSRQPSDPVLRSAMLTAQVPSHN